MEIYYTISSGQDTPVVSPYQSLGGYKSSTYVENDSFDGIFEEISLNKMKNQQTEYIALMLYNNENVDLTNITISITPPINSQCSFMVGATIPTLDANGEPYIERIRTIYSRPFTPVFVEATEENPANLGNLEAGGMLGLWLQRSFNSEEILTQYMDIAEKDVTSAYGARYKPIAQNKSESVAVVINWE